MWSNPRARAAVDSGETNCGEVREEVVVGKPGSHGSKAILMSHACIWVEAITMASFTPHASMEAEQ